MQAPFRRLIGLGCASAAATVALAAPATAAVLPHDPVGPPVAPPPHAVLGSSHFTSGSGADPAHTVTGSDGDWARFGYGAAGGVVLFAVGAAGMVLVRRRQHVPHHV